MRDGARRLRAQYATPLLARLREAVGLRDLRRGMPSRDAGRKAARPVDGVAAVFKQYREADGKFYFKLVDGERVLLQSAGFDSPKDAGMRIAALKRGEFDGADAQVALGDGVDADAVHAALAALAAAEAEQDMNLSGMPDLALMLFAPWFVILCVLYWLYPRQPRHARRRWFDAARW